MCKVRIENGWEVHRIKKGKHTSRSPFSIPEIRKKPGVEIWKVKFGENAAYRTADPQNQGDLCKGGGGSLWAFTNHRDSWMWAWRWNPVKKKIGLTSYFHKDGKRYMGPNRIQVHDGASIRVKDVMLSNVEMMLEVDLEEEFFLREIRDWGRMEFGVEMWKDMDRLERGFGKGTRINSGKDVMRFDVRQPWYFRKRERRIYFWFGGDEVAPHDITSYRKKVY